MGIGTPEVVKKGSGITPEMEDGMIKYIKGVHRTRSHDVYLYLVDCMRSTYGGTWKCHMACRTSEEWYPFLTAVSSDHSICLDVNYNRIFLWRTKETPVLEKKENIPEEKAEYDYFKI